MLYVKDAPKENLVVRGARVLDPVEGVDGQVDVRIDDACPEDHEIVPGSALDVKHQATSISSAASTATGPCVNRS